MKKKFHSFYTFELMIHFLAEEDFLNMHSDTLLNITFGVWIVMNIFHWKMPSTILSKKRIKFQPHVLRFLELC